MCCDVGLCGVFLCVVLETRSVLWSDMRCAAYVCGVCVICPLWGVLCRVVRVAKRYGVEWDVMLCCSAVPCTVLWGVRRVVVLSV